MTVESQTLEGILAAKLVAVQVQPRPTGTLPLAKRLAL